MRAPTDAVKDVFSRASVEPETDPDTEATAGDPDVYVWQETYSTPSTTRTIRDFVGRTVGIRVREYREADDGRITSILVDVVHDGEKESIRIDGQTRILKQLLNLREKGLDRAVVHVSKYRERGLVLAPPPVEEVTPSLLEEVAAA